MKNEKTIERQLREKVKKLGGMAIKITSPSFTGLPDRMILMPEGQIYFIETKSTGDKPRKRQLYVHKQLRNLGFEVFVIDSQKELDEFYETIEKK